MLAEAAVASSLPQSLTVPSSAEEVTSKREGEEEEDEEEDESCLSWTLRSLTSPSWQSTNLGWKKEIDWMVKKIHNLGKWRKQERFHSLGEISSGKKSLKNKKSYSAADGICGSYISNTQFSTHFMQKRKKN